ncbi:MAG: NTP transferase domain-containing protein [Clostridia bacterium]|nr:NTP transferase domain-containing protein [Clostridia bacterium]MBN2883069.1 NTP transferase domain-containing protein [Clostridia bacterium]
MKAIILGAGKGKRLQSEKHDLPKVMRSADGKPILFHVLESVDFCEEIIIVVGYKKEKVMSAAGPGYTYVDQVEMKGTGHAVAVTREALKGYEGPVLLAFGDMPLFRKSTYKSMFELHESEKAECTNLTCIYPIDEQIPHYGRIIRDEIGDFLEVREHRDCSEDQKKIRETNVGVMVCNAPDMYEYLSKLDCNNSQGEYYLTDLPRIIRQSGKKVIMKTIHDTSEVVGANTPEELEMIEKILKERKAGND